MSGTAVAHRRRSQGADREQVRRLARVLDEAFRVPGTKRRFGVDALVGLIPGVGDAAGLVLSSAVIIQAIKLGARGATVVRMVLNAGFDAAFGSIPVIGSIHDFVFKANTRNLRLLERHTIDPEATRAASGKAVRNTIMGAVIGLVAVTVALLALVVWVISVIF
jgi:hypothetical protein